MEEIKRDNEELSKMIPIKGETAYRVSTRMNKLFPRKSMPLESCRHVLLDMETGTNETILSYIHMDNLELIAKIAHNVNRGYCLSIGDNSQPTWEEAPQWQKDSAIMGVKFHLEAERSPSDSHNSWMKQKEEEGWKYGPVKDAEKKEHPCFVPYSELPKEQQTKDYLFKAVVDSFK